MKGIVYILTNKAMPGLVKIGKTKDINRRLKELYNTSVPYPFVCEYAVECEDMDALERKLHEDIFYDNRVNPKREFFEISLDKVVNILSLVGEDIKDQINEVLNEDTDDLEKDIVTNYDNLFFLKCKDCFSIMEVVDGKYILKKGSQIRKESVPCFAESAISDTKKREEILSSKIEERDDKYILTEDVICNSPSSAANIAAARPMNGRVEWKTKEGIMLGQIFD